MINRYFLLFGILSGGFFLYPYDYDIVNKTDIPLSVTWKSHGLGFTTKQGHFNLSPGNMCKGCISTHSNNCIHILFVESLDKTYRTRSKPFCKSAYITISLEDSKKWFFKKNKKQLKVTIDRPPVSKDTI